MNQLTKTHTFEIKISENECLPDPDKPFGWWESEGQHSNQFRAVFTDLVGPESESWMMKAVHSLTFNRNDGNMRASVLRGLMDAVNHVISERIQAQTP